MADTSQFLHEAQEHIRTTAAQEGETTLNLVFNALVTNARETCSVLPESIFVQYFLPFFAGRIDSNAQNNIMSSWISIAGSPMSEVAIIDSANTILYYVPAIFDTSFITAARQTKGMSFGQIYDQTNLLSNNLPVLGERFLMNALNEKVPALKEQVAINKTNEQRWIDIFTKYNVALPTTPNTTDITQHIQSIDSDEIYD